MHIITGLLLASIFNKKNTAKLPFQRYTGPIVTKHFIDGRIRFLINKLKNNQSLIDNLTKDICKIDGVDECTANYISGSLTIVYQPEKITPDLLFSVLIRLLQLEDEIEKIPRSKIENEIRTVGSSLNRAIYDKSNGLIDLKTAIPIALGVIGAQKIYREGWSTLPSGLILLWWAYQSFSSENK
jgi:hypothetical protein